MTTHNHDTLDPSCPICYRPKAADSVTFARVKTYLDEYGALIPTQNYARLARIMAEHLRRRQQFDSANYLDRAAAAMEP